MFPDEAKIHLPMDAREQMSGRLRIIDEQAGTRLLRTKRGTHHKSTSKVLRRRPKGPLVKRRTPFQTRHKKLNRVFQQRLFFLATMLQSSSHSSQTGAFMLSITDTAYPLLNSSPSKRDLDDIYTPDLFELGFAEQRTRNMASRIGLLVLLKTFQRLGYFTRISEVPLSIIRHIAKTTGYQEVPDLSAYDQSSLRMHHMTLVRILQTLNISSVEKAVPA